MARLPARIRARLTYANVASTACFCLLLAGVGYAAIPDGSGVFNACLDKSSGAVRLVDTPGCTPAELGTSWNRAGPAGPPGGIGPSTAYVAISRNQTSPGYRIRQEPWHMTLLSRRLPEFSTGSYMVNASFQLEPAVGVLPRNYLFWRVDCVLALGGTNSILDEAHVVFDKEVGSRMVMLQGSVRTALVTNPLTVRCEGFGFSEVYFSPIRLTAIRVDSIDGPTVVE